MDDKTPQTVVQLTVNSNFLLDGWLIYYGVLMQQAQQNDFTKDQVIKACQRVIEDLGDFDAQ